MPMSTTSTATRSPVAGVAAGGARADAVGEAVGVPSGQEPAPSGPPQLALDRGYAYAECRDAAAACGSTAHIPPKASAERPLPPPGHPDRHPPRRWVVEAAHSWFNRCRRLLTHSEKRARHDLGFVHLAAVLIVYRKLRHARSLSG